MPLTFCERLVASCEKNSNKAAMRIVGIDDETYTFEQLLTRIRSVAYRLEQEGVEFGDRVIVMGENHPSWAIAYLGSLYRGAVAVPLDPHGEIETITNFFENSEAKVAFLSPDQTKRFEQVQEKLGRPIPAVIWSDEASANGFQSFADWSSTKFPDTFSAAIPNAKNEDTAVLMYTSGTTGTPKGVPLTHGNIAAELDGINEVLKFSPTEKINKKKPPFQAYL